MAFTTGLCAVSAVLSLLDIHPFQLLVVVACFSIGVAIVAAQLELTIVAAGIRERQRNGKPHDVADGQGVHSTK